MKRIRLMVLVSLVLAGLPLMAATEFTLRVSSESNPNIEGTWRVHAEAGRFRADRDGEDVMYDAVLSGEGDSVIFLNSALKTWFDLEKPAEFSLHSRFLSPLQNAKAKKIRWELASGDIAGGKACVGELSYVVTGEVPGGFRTNVAVRAKVEIETSGQHAAASWPGPILPRTGFQEIDDRLAAAESQIEGMPVRLKLTTVRTYEGGAPFTDVMSVTASDFASAETEPLRFTKPDGYRYERPVMGGVSLGP